MKDINTGLDELRVYERRLNIISAFIYLAVIICILALMFRSYF